MLGFYPYPVLKMLLKNTRITGIIFLLLLAGFSSFSQGTIPELVFTNPQLSVDPGAKSAGSDGAVYVFQNVTSGVDALITIDGRSSGYVSLSNIDLAGPIQDPVNGTGFDNAWQPKVACNGGNAGANQNWWMEFQLNFVQHGDHTKPVSVSQFYATGLDDDGDGQSLNEFLSFYNMQSYTLEQNSAITVSSITGNMSNPQAAGKEFDGPDKNYAGISTSATDVMVTNYFLNANSIILRVGAKTGNHSSSAADRMYALWFKNFSFNTPQIGSLPLSLVSFTAQLNDENVMLNWVSELEINTSHFVIQRSVDGKDFDDDAIVFSEENNSVMKDYQFSDNINSIKDPLIYYRLKIVDMNGNYSYSNTILVRLGADQLQTAVLIYPNPAVNELRITIPNAWQNKTIVYSVYNSGGSLVKQRIEENAGQTETLPLLGLPSGLYLVNVVNGSQTAVQKLIKTDQ
jgi:hypothetical protein